MTAFENVYSKFSPILGLFQGLSIYIHLHSTATHRHTFLQILLESLGKQGCCFLTNSLLIVLVCPAGTFGQDCNSLCTCNTQNSVSCDHVTGACNCTEGWQGSTCDDDIDECAAPSSVTCPADSDCVNTRGGHVCECRAGFYKTATDQCQGETFDNSTLLDLVSK